MFRTVGRPIEFPFPMDAFWQEVAKGERPELNQGRLMSALTFSQPWPTWERHLAGEELVLLLAGVVTIVLEESSGDRLVMTITSSPTP
jgi:hypothetical protein